MITALTWKQLSNFCAAAWSSNGRGWPVPSYQLAAAQSFPPTPMAGTNNPASTAPNRNSHNSDADRCDTGNPAVDAVHVMATAGALTGNMVPHSWFKTIILKNGQPDLASITLLSEIVWWYKPRQDRKTRKFSQKFDADLLHMSRGTFEKKFGLDKRVTSAALKRLTNLGVIRCELRTINLANGGKLGNALFIELLPEGLAKVSPTLLQQEGDPITSTGNSYHQKPSQLLPEEVTAMAFKRKTNTESTTETSTSPSVPSRAKRAPSRSDKENNSNSDREAVARNRDAAAAPSAAVAQDSAAQSGGFAPQTPEGNGNVNGVYQDKGGGAASRNGRWHNSPGKAGGQSGEAAEAKTGIDEADQDDGSRPQASGGKENELPGVKPRATSPAAGVPEASANKAVSSPATTRAAGAGEQAGEKQADQTRGGAAVDKRQKKQDAATANAEKKADKAVRYLWIAQTNLRNDGVTGFRALRDHQVAHLTCQLTDYFLENPTYKVSRVIGTIVACWTIEPSEPQWYAKKICESLLVATATFNAKPYPNLDGAAIQLGIGDLARGDSATDELFEAAGILDEWRKEHSTNSATSQDAPAPTEQDKNDPPLPVNDDAKSMTALLEILGNGPMIKLNWQTEARKKLNMDIFDFNALVDVLESDGEIERTELGYIRVT